MYSRLSSIWCANHAGKSAEKAPCRPKSNLPFILPGGKTMLVSVLLLPLFFALNGTRTRLDLLNDGAMWLWAGLVLMAAVFGKMGGAALAARWTGQSWRNAIALGVLLNTRGLVELVVLNIAYSLGAFTPTLFTMLVVMALLTTMLTTAILTLLGIRGAAKKQPGSVPVSLS
jgi:Kef-type K+ transport system membrane component KefB